MSQSETDIRNARFWEEVCGSGLARSLGIEGLSQEALRRFDEAYRAIYPYLEKYVLRERLENKRVLEIGLGYGTFGQMVASRGSDYHGIDIAEGPVTFMRYRLAGLGQNGQDKVQVASALGIPYGNMSFEYVYTIGCLHHTGNLPKAVQEIHRVLVPKGKAIVMLYNRHSFRQLVQVPFMRLCERLRCQRTENFAERVRALYDANVEGEAAPHTDYVSRGEVKRLFKAFSKIQIRCHNFDTYTIFRNRITIPRERLLNNVGRILGLDLYITAIK